MTDLPFERCADCEIVCAGCRFAHNVDCGLTEPATAKRCRTRAGLFFAILLTSAIWYGCTVTPHQVVSRTPSLDGTNRNSGLLGFSATGDCVLTEHAKQRYDSLVRRFGDRFEVPVKEGDGLTQTNGYWILSEDRCADFETMTRWSR